MSKSFEISFRDNYSVVVKDFTLKTRPENTDNISDYFRLSTKKVRFANIIQDKDSQKILCCCCIEEAENGNHTISRVFLEDSSIFVSMKGQVQYCFRNYNRLAGETAQLFVCDLGYNKDQLKSNAEFVTIVYEFKNPVRPKSTMDLISKRYAKYFENEENFDITFVTDGEEIKANKHHLMVMSNVFEAMFDSSWEEKNKIGISIKGTTAKAFKLFIALMHGMEPKMKIEVETALEIILLADRYDVRDIGNNVALDVLNRVTTYNVIKVLNVGFLANYKELKEAAIQYLKQKPVAKLCDIPDYESITPAVMEYICGEAYQQMLPVK